MVGNQAKVNAETYLLTIEDCRAAQKTRGRAREMRCSVLFDTPLISRGSERAESVLVVPGIRSGGLLFGDFCLCRGWRIAWEVSARWRGEAMLISHLEDVQLMVSAVTT